MLHFPAFKVIILQACFTIVAVSIILRVEVWHELHYTGLYIVLYICSWVTVSLFKNVISVGHIMCTSFKMVKMNQYPPRHLMLEVRFNAVVFYHHNFNWFTTSKSLFEWRAIIIYRGPCYLKCSFFFRPHLNAALVIGVHCAWFEIHNKGFQKCLWVNC